VQFCLTHFNILLLLYECRSRNSRTVLLSKHTVKVENQNYYELVLPGPLLYITYRGFIYDVTLAHYVVASHWGFGKFAFKFKSFNPQLLISTT